MSNAIQRGYKRLVQQAEDAADGAHTHGAAIGLAHVNETTIRSAIEALVGKPAGPGGSPVAVAGLKQLWGEAKANKTAKTGLARSANSNGRYLARACIRDLMTPFGEAWNSKWNITGLTEGSLAVDGNPLDVLQVLRSFYGANPSYEKPDNHGTPLTAAACEAAALAVNAAGSASNLSNELAGQAHKAFQAGEDLLYTTLSDLLNELGQLLDPDDERWLAFGFDKPSDLGTPTIPENVVVTVGATGSKMLFVDFDDGRNDESYRVTGINKATGLKIAEVIVTESETTFTFPTLPAGTLIDILVTGRNDKGESQPTEAVTAAVP